MTKNPQVLQIEPADELTFKGPFTNGVTCQLKLNNPSNRQVCFKVKTTAPKQYCVRPNSGIIQPGETSDVAVMLQPFEAAVNLELERSKHKFLVQSIYAPSGDFTLDSVWKIVPQSEFMDSKLRVVFDNGSVPDNSTEAVNVSPPLSLTPSSIIQPDVKQELLEVKEQNKVLEAAKAAVEKEFEHLKARLTSLDAQPTGLMNITTDQGIAIFQSIMLAVAGLIVGLILGKLF